MREVKISNTLPPADQLFLQGREGAGTEIPQHLALHVRPNQLDGIELRRIGRQIPDYPSKRGVSVLKVRQDAPDGCSRRSWR